MTLRESLTRETARDFADHLPPALRDVFLGDGGADPAPADRRIAEAFAARIAQRLPPAYPFEADTVARAVLRTVRDRIDVVDAAQMLAHLPPAFGELWMEGFV